MNYITNPTQQINTFIEGFRGKNRIGVDHTGRYVVIPKKWGRESKGKELGAVAKAVEEAVAEFKKSPNFDTSKIEALKKAINHRKSKFSGWSYKIRFFFMSTRSKEKANQAKTILEKLVKKVDTASYLTKSKGKEFSTHGLGNVTFGVGNYLA